MFEKTWLLKDVSTIADLSENFCEIALIKKILQIEFQKNMTFDTVEISLSNWLISLWQE